MGKWALERIPPSKKMWKIWGTTNAKGGDGGRNLGEVAWIGRLVGMDMLNMHAYGHALALRCSHG